jgi:hypothetical protein
MWVEIRFHGLSGKKIEQNSVISLSGATHEPEGVQRSKLQIQKWGGAPCPNLQLTPLCTLGKLDFPFASEREESEIILIKREVTN